MKINKDFVTPTLLSRPRFCLFVCGNFHQNRTEQNIFYITSTTVSCDKSYNIQINIENFIKLSKVVRVGLPNIMSNG